MFRNFTELLTPSLVFGVVKWVFSYVGWLLPSDKDTALRRWLENLRKSCHKSGVLLQFRSALSRISQSVNKNRLLVASTSIPVSILLNLCALLWLTQMYSSLPPEYTPYLFITYKWPFFVSLVLWNLFSFYVVLRIIITISENWHIWNVARYIFLNLVLVISLGDVQFELGGNLSSALTADVNFKKYGIGFPYVTSYEHLIFALIVVVLVSKYYSRIPLVGRSLLWCIAAYLCIGIVESFYYTVRAFNFVSTNAPRPFLMYIPQARARAILLFNLSTFYPCLLYIIALGSFLFVSVLPKTIYGFLSINLAALARDKKSLFSRLGWIAAALCALVVYLLQSI